MEYIRTCFENIENIGKDSKTHEEKFKEIFQQTDLPYDIDGGRYKGNKTIYKNYRLAVRKNEYGAWLCNIQFSFDAKGNLIDVRKTGEI
ncbi:MAG: hypothetical protein PHQ35_09445 [Phycisphaerae bacterium]|nr:hypothetical protein [Phycisphaerae bacterium]MDD5239941.1 hypothetical protein [Candidatus Nanoarchaeia archaeon]